MSEDNRKRFGLSESFRTMAAVSVIIGTIKFAFFPHKWWRPVVMGVVFFVFALFPSSSEDDE
jgi:hypothetical protein